MRPSSKAIASALLVTMLPCVRPISPVAQGSPFSDSLLARIRTAARSVTGTRPRDIRYLSIAETSARLSDLVAGVDSQRVPAIIAVFQIRFDDRYIMADAGVDTAGIRQFQGTGAGYTYWGARYDSVRNALRHADRIVLTHEHWDHASGVQHGADFTQVAGRTYLTREQLATLLAPPIPIYLRLSADSARAFRTVEYDLLHVLAPGVVLIKAPGHSPGSQFVYVQLQDGREALLIGDLVWMMAGLTGNHQKPQGVSDGLQESRTQVQAQMNWVRSLMRDSSIAIIPCHDKRQLDSLRQTGILGWGLDLRRN